MNAPMMVVLSCLPPIPMTNGTRFSQGGGISAGGGKG